MSTGNFRGWVLPALVVILLLLAGCATETTDVQPEVETASSQSESATQPAQQTQTADQVATPTSQQTTPGQNQNLSEYGGDLQAGAANISEENRQRVRELISGFYEGLPENSSDRRELFLDSAEAICERDRQARQDPTLSTLREGGETTGDGIRRVHYAAQIVNELNGDVPLEPFGDARTTLTEASKYTPLIGSYNQLSQSSCAAADNRSDAAIRDFQTAAVMFGVDSALISTGAFYQPAFAGTRFITNRASQVGLYRLRYVCGDRCWALAMSEIHVSLRGSMHTVTSTLLRQSQEFNVSVSRADLEAVASSLDTEANQMLENAEDVEIPDSLRSVPGEAVSCVNAMREGTDEEENPDDGGLFGNDGPDLGDAVEEGQAALEDSKQTIGRCRDESD